MQIPHISGVRSILYNFGVHKDTKYDHKKWEYLQDNISTTKRGNVNCLHRTSLNIILTMVLKTIFWRLNCFGELTIHKCFKIGEFCCLFTRFFNVWPNPGLTSETHSSKNDGTLVSFLHYKTILASRSFF